ncbi:hypothetical protein MYX84_00720 [Acidobacteria bacterium AH-259-O06]|nr:hypothetical protein [Acidobacteria bacterium AH-259-O06]
MSSFQSKWMEFSPRTSKERVDKSDKSPSVSFVKSISEHGQQKNGKQADHSWQDFYPDLDPADFEIEETAGGISGRKAKGNVAGTVGFFIPWERLKEGPAGQVEDPGEWETSELRIPSQVKANFVDVWSLWRRRCGVGFRFRFLRCERAGG